MHSACKIGSNFITLSNYFRFEQQAMVPIDNIIKFLQTKEKIRLSASDRERILKSRQVVDAVLQRGEMVYGINTGFGKLSQVKVDSAELEQLQLNLIHSHACGVGAPVDQDTVILTMYLKLKSLIKGYSGCSLAIVEKLAELLNKQIYPVIPCKGSVGASGDLAPLAHMALALIGEGRVSYQDRICSAAELVAEQVYQPVQLQAKDGLSLINGTQYSTALLTRAFIKARDLTYISELAAAMSIEADLATDVAFQPEIHALRQQNGQQKSARHMRQFLQESQIIASHRDCDRVQDPYCYRCIPQVLGMVWDTLGFVATTLTRELEAVTDNPLVFPEQEKILSAGNFHAEPLALAADYLAIAMTELCNISERRIANLTDSSMSPLPSFLVENSGQNSGFMLAHVTAAALTAENRTLANPAAVETISTSANQEDHVSMAPNACLKLNAILDNVQQVIAIELMAAAQGMDFRKPLTGGRGSQWGYQQVRKQVAYLDHDRIMYEDLAKIKSLCDDQAFISQIKKIAAD